MGDAALRVSVLISPLLHLCLCLCMTFHVCGAPETALLNVASFLLLNARAALRVTTILF